MRVTLYSRPGCHLCDDARAVLQAQRARTPFDLEEVSIESSDRLLADYGLRIPVVVVDGREEFEVTVDAAAFADLVGG
jgi:glutaredoxin